MRGAGPHNCIPSHRVKSATILKKQLYHGILTVSCRRLDCNQNQMLYTEFAKSNTRATFFLDKPAVSSYYEVNKHGEPLG